jgi:hypothetical protein
MWWAEGGVRGGAVRRRRLREKMKRRKRPVTFKPLSLHWRSTVMADSWSRPGAAG